jgi:hypothetical protein
MEDEISGEAQSLMFALDNKINSRASQERHVIESHATVSGGCHADGFCAVTVVQKWHIRNPFRVVLIEPIEFRIKRMISVKVGAP